MANEHNPDEATQQLATERNKIDSKEVYSNYRAAAQSLLFMNGGAAAAVISFIGAAHLSLSAARSVGLGLFAIGIVCGACIFGIVGYHAQKWTDYWQRKVLGTATPNEGDALIEQSKCRELALVTCFAIGILCFIIGGLVFAVSNIRS
jgi:hypothetical protein